MRLGSPIIVLAVAILVSCAVLSQSGSKARSKVMNIEFHRAGGMAPLTNISGSVTLTDAGGEVTSDDGTYQRTLTADEVKQLRASIDPPASAAPQPESPQLMDGFLYSIALTSQDGKTRKLSINAGNKLDLRKLPSGEARLLAWVEAESDKILENRVKKP
jgi:hypothetical protein